MTSQQNNTLIKQDLRFTRYDHHCLLPGASKIKCDHWGCKVTAKQPKYYPGLEKFFKDLGTTRFHFHRSDLYKFAPEQLKNVPADINPNQAWLTPMNERDGDKPELNTAWIVEAQGYWPERNTFNIDEVRFIHVEYETMRGQQSNSVIDVKEVAIFVGK